MLYENAILVENESHKNRYLAPKDFIALIEGQEGVINFIKDLAISGPAAKTVFTVIKRNRIRLILCSKIRID